MSQFKLEMPSFVNLLTFGWTPDTIFGLLSCGRICKVENTGSEWKLSQIFEFSQEYLREKIGGFVYKIAFLDENCLLTVSTTGSKISKCCLLNVWNIIENNSLEHKVTLQLAQPLVQIFPVRSEKTVYFCDLIGNVQILHENFVLSPFVSSFTGKDLKFGANVGRFCLDFQVLIHQNEKLILLRNERYQFFIDGIEVANNVNSFVIYDQEFLVLTTLNHKIMCVPIGDLFKGNFRLQDYIDKGTRNVERGSRIVVTHVAECKVVLQMPRGNLETIHPRRLLISRIQTLLDESNYKESVQLMKRHRLDTNLTCDHNYAKFLANIDRFIDSVDDSLIFNIFLSELRPENVTSTIYAPFYDNNSNAQDRLIATAKINEVCIKMRESLLRDKCDNGRKYFTSLLTTYVKNSPPDFDSALLLIKKYRDSNENDSQILVEQGLKHLFYLADVNLLLDMALGTYDFDLVLMVAEKSQKDPKELLPFLNDLKRLEPEHYRMFKIDLHLGRYKKALSHVIACGPSKFDECLKLIKEQKLFVEALKYYETKEVDEQCYKKICSLYAEFLCNEKRYEESGTFYRLAGQQCKALESFVNALHPTLFRYVARHQDNGDEFRLQSARRLAQKLKDAKRFKEAAEIYFDFEKDVVKCIECLTEGNLFEEALEKIDSSANSQLIALILIPGVKLYFRNVLDFVQKNRTLHEKYVKRLEIVRSKKKAKFEEATTAAKSSGDYEFEDDTYSEVGSSIISRVSTTGLSTKASTTARAKRQLAKKEEKKRFVLKENSPFEDLALLNALHEIVNQLENVQAEIGPKLRLALLLNLNSEALHLQTELKNFVKCVESTLQRIWPTVIDLTIIPGPLSETISFLTSTENPNSENQSIIVQENVCNMMLNSNHLVPTNLKIKLEPLLIKPKLNTDLKWTIDFYKDA